MKNPLRLSARFALVGLFFAANAVLGEPPNLSRLKQEIVAYVESGAYDREMTAAAAPAAKFITERAAHHGAGERLAIVLDIDETVLSNLPTIRANDFGYVPSVWDAWVAKAEAPAIPAMLEVFQAARKTGVDVIFITGRHERDRPGTEKNLRKAGFGDYAALFCKADDSRETTEKFKTETRRRLVADGRVIVANIGDQESDLAGGFSERTFKLPDPFYITQ
jgi:acid phosphatase